jgi:hypothetical protein
MQLDLNAAALFSPDRRYRYLLRRNLDPSNPDGPPLVSIGYNPSVADEHRLDPTLRREMEFARRFGCSSLIKVNAFAGIATHPDGLALMDDPVGLNNDEAIMLAARYCVLKRGLLLATWGTPKGKPATKLTALRRFDLIVLMLGEVEGARDVPIQALRLTKGGFPEHPLYLPKTVQPFPFLATKVAIRAGQPSGVDMGPGPSARLVGPGPSARLLPGPNDRLPRDKAPARKKGPSSAYRAEHRYG